MASAIPLGGGPARGHTGRRPGPAPTGQPVGSAGRETSELDDAPLEDGARGLEEAAEHLRAADRAFTTEERNEHIARAQTTLARADAIRPDLSRVAAQDIADAGIPLSEVPGPELPGAGAGDDGLDRLAQVQAELDGDPDPFADVPDPGDFGLAPVDGPVATAAGSLTEDAYMDQPDVGSTGAYSDAYGDTEYD